VAGRQSGRQEASGRVEAGEGEEVLEPKPPKKGVGKHVANSCKPFFNILRHVACVIPKVFPPCVEARCW